MAAAPKRPPADGPVEVVLLGTGGPLRHDRARMGLLVTAPGCAPLLIDTCGGFEIVQQLHRAGYGLADLRHVVITHRHGDHIGGTTALLMTGQLWDFYGSEDALNGVKELAAVTYPEWRLPPTVAFRAVSPRRAYEIGGFAVTFFQVEHRVPTLAVRVSRGGRTLAYSADSLPCQELVACAQDADLFVCDALASSLEGPERAARARQLMHPTALEAGRMAARANARALALVHFGSAATPDLMTADAAAAYAGPISAPEDGARYALG
jgi:ribonuclease BN (tRNA processing enzyme)